MDRRILIGRVTSAHGIKGDLKVHCYADDADLLFSDDGVFTDETTQKRVVLSFKAEPKANLFIATLPGITDRNAAEKAKGTAFYINEDQLPELDDDQIYHSELEGMDVVSPEGNPMGKVIRVQNFGAGDLLEVQGKNESYYIPFAPPFLVELDKPGRRVVMNQVEVMGG